MALYCVLRSTEYIVVRGLFLYNIFRVLYVDHVS